MDVASETETKNEEVVLVIPPVKAGSQVKTRTLKKTTKNIRFTIDWDVPSFTTISDLIRAQITLQHYERKLQESQASSSDIREELDDGWRRIQEKKEHLRSVHVEFDKLGSQEKQERTKTRHVNEKHLEDNLDRQIENVREEVLELRAVKEKMDAYYQEYRIFPDYLERIVAESNEFDSVQDIINRYETLAETHTNLKQQVEDLFKGMVATRAALEDVLENKSSEFGSLSNKLVELFSRADAAKNERRNWEMIIEKIKTLIADKYLEQKLVRTSCWNLYQQMCRQRKLPEAAKEDDIDQQLIFIKKTMLHYKRVVKIATNENTLCARSNVPNSSNISVNKL